MFHALVGDALASLFEHVHELLTGSVVGDDGSDSVSWTSCDVLDYSLEDGSSAAEAGDSEVVSAERSFEALPNRTEPKAG